MLALLLACVPDNPDTAEPSACGCGGVEDLALQVTRSGGFDDWSGAAMAWAVDAVNGRVLVAAMEYELGHAQIDIAPFCQDPSALSESWYPAVPDTATEAAEDYPLLAAALTTAVGVRSLSDDVGVLLLEGDVTSATPDRVWVATGGEASLLRGEGGNGLQGAFIFAAQATEVGGPAEVACDEAVRVPGIDIAFDSYGID